MFTLQSRSSNLTIPVVPISCIEATELMSHLTAYRAPPQWRYPVQTYITQHGKGSVQCEIFVHVRCIANLTLNHLLDMNIFRLKLHYTSDKLGCIMRKLMICLPTH